MSIIFKACARIGVRPWRLVGLALAISASLALPVLSSTPAGAQTSQPGVGGSTSTEPSGGGPASGVSATVEQCLTALEASGRSATFSGQMVAVMGTARMTMRIDVQERAPGDALFHTLIAPGLGVWRRSAGGVKIYRYLKQVTNLPAPGAFRAVVRFRWLNDQGRMIRHVERHTPVCEQPDVRPKLVVEQVRATPLPGSPQAGYQIVLRNEGRAPAGLFGVSLTIGGLAQALPGLPTLAAGARTVLDTHAPRCSPGSTIEVQIDPSHQIPEASGGGLNYTAPCPLAETGVARVGDTSGAPTATGG